MNPLLRSALLGTTALVVAGRAPALADITINSTVGTQTPTTADNVSVQNTGKITGAPVGVNVFVIAGQVTVDLGGKIQVTNNGIRVLSASDISGGISNSGTISGSVSYGVSVNSSSSISGGVSNNGKILGGKAGIYANLSSSISKGIINATSALISGGSYGIYTRSSSTIFGGVTNSGTISGATAIYIDTNSSIAGGIANFNGGTIIGALNNLGTISGDSDAVQNIASSSISGGINNSGEISSNRYAIFNAFGSNISNGITNQTSALISGGDHGLYNFDSNIDGGVTNSGMISGVHNGIFNEGTAIINDGITNLLGATIHGGSVGIFNRLGTISGGINNSGSISGKIGIANSRATILDGITNETGGTISGSGTGIGAIYNIDSTISGGIRNNGSIVDATFGIGNVGSSTIEGGIINTSLIAGNAKGINNTLSSTIDGGISNEAGATITSRIGISVSANSLVDDGINNAGLIHGDVIGIEIKTGSAIDDGINNSGTISGATAIFVDSSSSINGGIDNSGTITGIYNDGTIDAATIDYGIYNHSSGFITGGINNSGIVSGGKYGINNEIKSTIEDGITNVAGAVISGNSVGIFNQFSSTISGGINNSGTISSANSGIINSFSSSIEGGITIAVGASISIDGTGIRNQTSIISGGIANSGAISGGHVAISNGLSSLLEGGITNAVGASISGSIVGIHNVGAGTITGGIANSGMISGGVNGINNLFSSSIEGGISNAAGATIFGSSVGIFNRRTSTITGGINNSGSIFGGSIGILNSARSSISGGINNSGTISGSEEGIQIDTSSLLTGGITNSGKILSADEAIEINHGSTLDGGISNSGTISGSAQGIQVDNSSVLNGGVQNSGLIIGGSFGIELETGTLNGGITNSGTISGSTGIFVDDLSTLTGGISNSGKITGTNGVALGFGDEDDLLTLMTGSSLTGISDGRDGDDVLRLEGTGSEDDGFIAFEQLNMNGTNWTLSADLTLNAGGLGGDVNINSGTLNMNGTLTAPGGVNVTGTLGGGGAIIGAVTLAPGGSIAPGNSIGILNIGGDVNFGAGSTFEVEVEGTLADLLLVDGNVIIDPGATLNVLPLSMGIDVQDTPILQATGTVDANFSTVNGNGLIVSSALVGGNEIVLTALSTTGASANMHAAIQEGFGFQNTLREGPSEFAGEDKRYWVQGLYEDRERKANGDFAGFSQETYGWAAGGDRLVKPNLRLGMALGIGESRVKQKSNLGETDSQTLHGGAYGLYQKNAVTWSFGGSLGRQDMEVSRPVLLAGQMTDVEGETLGHVTGLYGGVSLANRYGPVWSSRLGLGAGYIHQITDGFVDDAGVGFDDVSTDTWRAGPSLEVIGTFKVGKATLISSVKAGWQQQWMMGDDTVDLIYASGTRIPVALEQSDEGRALVGLGLNAIFSGGTNAYVIYNAEIGDEEDQGRFALGVKMGF